MQRTNYQNNETNGTTKTSLHLSTADNSGTSYKRGDINLMASPNVMSPVWALVRRTTTPPEEHLHQLKTAVSSGKKEPYPFNQGAEIALLFEAEAPFQALVKKFSWWFSFGASGWN